MVSDTRVACFSVLVSPGEAFGNSEAKLIGLGAQGQSSLGGAVLTAQCLAKGSGGSKYYAQALTHASLVLPHVIPGSSFLMSFLSCH